MNKSKEGLYLVCVTMSHNKIQNASRQTGICISKCGQIIIGLVQNHMLVLHGWMNDICDNRKVSHGAPSQIANHPHQVN